MSDLSEAARAAWLDSQQDRIDRARQVLADVLDPFDVSGLDTPHVDIGDGRVTVVFSDGRVHLAVVVRDDRSGVWLASDDDGWGWDGPEVTSLADLGRRLPAPEEGGGYPAWVQPTGAHDAYPLTDGDGNPTRVVHNGKVWENLVDGNAHEPGVSGWREVA